MPEPVKRNQRYMPGLDGLRAIAVLSVIAFHLGFDWAPGGMLGVEVDGDVEAGMRVCDALELAWVATSLGGTHTLVGHAASTTHRQMDPDARRAAGIADGLIRVSVGLEDVEDLIEDFDRALEKA